MKKIYMILLLSLTVTLANATVHVVIVNAFSFSPATVSAVCGDTIGWQLGSGSHTTTSTTIPSCAAAWNAPINASSPVFAIVVTCAGAWNYICTPHGFTGVINVTCSTGIEEHNTAVSFVYPNPSQDGRFNVSLEATASTPTELLVTNAEGRTLLSESVSSGTLNHALNLEALSSGVYFLVLNNEKGRRVFKLMR